MIVHYTVLDKRSNLSREVGAMERGEDEEGRGREGAEAEFMNI